MNAAIELNAAGIPCERHVAFETAVVLGSAAAHHHFETAAHAYRVVLYAIRMAETYGIGRVNMEGLILGAFLHDVGKIGISDAILLKPEPLTEGETALMRTHVDIGARIISCSRYLIPAADVVKFHHERWDGSGYPCGCAGRQIPLEARIFALADVFDALVSVRPYKAALAPAQALRTIEGVAGAHFDPALVPRFMRTAMPTYGEIGALDLDALASHVTSIARGYCIHRSACRGQVALADASANEVPVTEAEQPSDPIHDAPADQPFAP
jgi:putative nucleotidyltransferase with HDIG domain